MKRVSLFLFVFLISISINAQKESQQAEKVVVETINKSKLQNLIKERKGKMLFLNLWATWCVPCREEFPSIIKLVNDFRDVDFIGISVDFPDEVESKIIPFLKSQKVNFVSYVNNFEGDEELINLLDANWNGALPATFIFDKNGKKISMLEGKKSYDEFKKEIEKTRKK